MVYSELLFVVNCACNRFSSCNMEISWRRLPIFNFYLCLTLTKKVKMKGVCRIWSRGRHYSPSLPGDKYLKRCWKKRSPGRNLGEHRLVRRSGNTSRSTALLVFCWRMRSFPKSAILTIFLGKKYPRRVK